MTFPTKKALKNWLFTNNFIEMTNGNFYQRGTYYLCHGEYAMPEFSLRRYKDGWSLHAIYHYYSGAFDALNNGRVASTFFDVYELAQGFAK